MYNKKPNYIERVKDWGACPLNSQGDWGPETAQQIGTMLADARRQDVLSMLENSDDPTPHVFHKCKITVKGIEHAFDKNGRAKP